MLVHWFYGDPLYGSMGMHYSQPVDREDLRLSLVEIHKISNDWMAVTNGHFMPTHKFNKKEKREGYLGYFAKADIPDIPEDILNLFKN